MNGPLLVIDPGHGGSQTAGASSPNRGTGDGGLLEKDVALDVARRTRDRLTADHVVVLTRDSDTNLSLAERAATAKRLSAAVFVSIHFSGKDPAVDRTDVVVAAAASNASRILADNVKRRVGEATGASGEVLHADLGQITAERHDPATAACLVEMASLAPAGRAALLSDPAYRDKLADALAAAIRESVNSVTPLTRPQWVGAQAWSRAREIYPPDIDLTYSVTGIADAVATWGSWLARRERWEIGVPDTMLTRFPHAAICQLKLYDASGNEAWGTGFYIADEVLLSCGHNFYDQNPDGSVWTTTRVEVQPGHSPRMSILPSKTFDVDHTQLVHPKWLASFDANHDLSVLRVPGLPATAGAFGLANVSLAQDQGIVVCGYGKVRGSVPFEDQGQRLDGAHISKADFDLIYYPMMTKGGHSGSPVFHESMVVGVHTAGDKNLQLNHAVLLTPDKEDWIVSKAGPGVTFGLSLDRGPTVGYSQTDQNSTQSEQSQQVRINIAHSVGLAEASLRYNLVHFNSARVNFGIGSWTGTRIAAVMNTYAAYAAEKGLTDQMLSHFGGQGGFDAIRDAFIANGTATVLTAGQQAQLSALGSDTQLQPAQDRHLAEDIRAVLHDIGNKGNPWYPFIDGGMGAISEIAAHVLVHAQHQSGPGGLTSRLTGVINSFGGETALGQSIVAGTVTEKQFLERLAAAVTAGVSAKDRDGVRRRYERLWQDWGSSKLSYYFAPAN